MLCCHIRPHLYLIPQQEDLVERYNENRILCACGSFYETENVSALIALDNETTHNLCTKLKGKGQNKMDFDAINRIHNLMVTDISSIFRMPSTTRICMESEMISRATIMGFWNENKDSDGQFQRRTHRFLNFWTPSYCPLFLTSYQQEIDNQLNARALTKRIMNRQHEGTEIVDRYQLIYRGNLDMDQIKKPLENRFEDEDQYKVYNVRTSSSFTKTSAVKLDNGNGWIKDRLKGILDDAEAMYKPKKFVDLFVDEGISEFEIIDAFEGIRKFIEGFGLEISDYNVNDSDEDEDGDDSDDDDENEEEDEDSVDYDL